MRRFDEAIAELKKAAELEPKSFESHLNLGVVYTKKGDYKEATREFLKAGKLNPNETASWYNLGLIYEALGFFDRAEAEYSRCLSLAPAFYPARQRLLSVREKGASQKEAVKAGRLSSDTLEELSQARMNLGILFFEMEKFTEAEAEFNKAISFNPLATSALINLGIIYRLKGEREKAIECFERAGKILPLNEMAKRLLTEMREEK
jgi:tetratricopeptide (TPR) repeat protein